MGAMNLITNAYATLRTTVGLKRMWIIAIISDLLVLAMLIEPLRICLMGRSPANQLSWLLGGVALLVGKCCLEFAAHRLISELPRLPIKEVQALSSLNLLARIWTWCFLALVVLIALNVAAGVMLMVSLVAGIILGVFAWLLFQADYLKFIETLMSPFLGFFKTEDKLLSLFHVSTEAAIAVGFFLFAGLFLLPSVVALIVLLRRTRLREGNSGAL